MKKVSIFLLISLVNLIPLEPLLAQDAYKWTDKSGRVIYGNKAPKAGNDIKTITTRGLSKYNSDKVLKRMGSDITEKVKESESSSIKTEDAEGQIKNMGGAAEGNLETLEVDAVRDEEGRYTSVKVVVKNPGSKEALDVSVAFRFSDGSLVPAEGPFEIVGGGQAEYKIPNELLPVELKKGIKDEIPKAIAHCLSL